MASEREDAKNVAVAGMFQSLISARICDHGEQKERCKVCKQARCDFFVLFKCPHIEFKMLKQFRDQLLAKLDDQQSA